MPGQEEGFATVDHGLEVELLDAGPQRIKRGQKALMDTTRQILAFDQRNVPVIQPIQRDPKHVTARSQRRRQRAPERHNGLITRCFAVVEGVHTIVQHRLRDPHGGWMKPHGGESSLHSGGRRERRAILGNGVGQMAGSDQAAGQLQITHGVSSTAVLSHVLLA